MSVVIPVDTDQVQIAVQQPHRSTDFSVQPPMGQPVADADGFNYVSGTVPAVKSGSKVTTTISYTKTDSEPSDSTAVSTPTQKSTSKLLIYVLVALVVVVIGFCGLPPLVAAGGCVGWRRRSFRRWRGSREVRVSPASRSRRAGVSRHGCASRR